MSKLNINTNKNFDENSVNIPIEMDKIEMLSPSVHISRSRRRSASLSPLRLSRDVASAADDAEHLLQDKPQIKRAEFDDDDELDIDDPKTPQPGVDDGFYYGETDEIPENGHHPSNGIGPRRRPSITPRTFPYAPDYGPYPYDINRGLTPMPDGSVFSNTNNNTNVNTNPNSTQPNLNEYQQKKTLAQGMMDLALLSANANQLRYVLESYNRHPYYYPSVVFISLSLIFQIAVGVGLILNSRYDVNDKVEVCKANKINNFTVLGIFIVTIVNVFISAFGVSDAPRDNNG